MRGVGILPPLRMSAEHRTRARPRERREGAGQGASPTIAAALRAVIGALLEGFAAADRAALDAIVRDGTRSLHAAVIAVILRIAFLQRAAARGLDVDGGALARLHRALRLPGASADAWTSLRALFGRVHATRGGGLFDPAAHPCLSRLALADASVLAVLEGLAALGGGRPAADDRDVALLGAIHEATLGDTLGRADGPSVAPRPDDPVIALAELLSLAPGERARRLGGRSATIDLDGVRAAATIEDLVDALGRSAGPRGPRIVAAGSLYLRPGPDRRRSGSHYTPRALAGPIVDGALRPALARIGPTPTAARWLDLSICDPAMGSGAFLAAACRRIGDCVARAWRREGAIDPPRVLAVRARREVATRCLYGVDRDPVAVELARLSLWLVIGDPTLPLTGLDHALRCGDALVGLTRAQIDGFRWDDVPPEVPARPLDRARERARGDAALHAFFCGGEKEREREAQRAALHTIAERARAGDAAAAAVIAERAAELRGGERPVAPFHWEIELPQIFARDDPGFDCVIGNPPFMGGVRISSATSPTYLAYLNVAYPGAGGQADLAAYFFRRGFALLRRGGGLGFLSTNTVCQGDTRTAGLRAIVRAGGSIYAAQRRVRWDGDATVVPCVVWITRGAAPRPARLDGRPVPRISAFLLPRGGDDDPARLRENAGVAFKGVEPYGDGFVFEDGNAAANSLDDLRALLARAPRCADRIFPYLGGFELNTSPRHAPSRWVIDLGDATLAEAAAYPELLAIAEARVRPERLRKAADVARWPWWQFWRSRPELRAATRGLAHVLALADTSRHLALARVPAGVVLNKTLVVFALDEPAAFCVLQSRVHEVWSRCFGSTMRDDLRYTATDCFETFPFPAGWRASAELAAIGGRYEALRAARMIDRGEGLTATYNRFHDPDEDDPAIVALRRLHDDLDRAVLAAYEWDDLAARVACGFHPEHDDGASERVRWWWAPELRDEVLARLLALNERRAAAGRARGL